MCVLQNGLPHDAEVVGKERRFKALSPDAALERLTEALGNLVGRKTSVDQYVSLEDGRIGMLGDHRLKRAAEALVTLFADGEARRHGMSPEAKNEAGLDLGDEIEHVAQMNARNRAPRALEFTFGRAGEGDGRAVHLFLDARGDETDDAFAEAVVKE